MTASMVEKLLEKKAVTYTAAAVGVCATTYFIYKKIGGDTGFRTSITKLGNTGSLAREDFAAGIDAYNEFFQQSDGKGVGERKFNTPKFVDTFYSLITDFYEYGWGQSFHFAPRNKGESFDESIWRHEERIADQIKANVGMHILDAGCGVGGPMRTIAKHSGAKITGITINEYQVKRCTDENIKAGLNDLCNIVQGSFLEMPFSANSFDGCYCIEAACHAPILADLYKEIFKVLKPGAYFASYEWLTTPIYDSNNAEHVRIVDDIAEGNALPDVRSIPAALDAAKEAGFEVVFHGDYALGADIPWEQAMKTARRAAFLTDVLTKWMERFGLAPRGTWATHQMLLRAAEALEKSGDLGIFTPMYLVTLRKPVV